MKFQSQKNSPTKKPDLQNLKNAQKQLPVYQIKDQFLDYFKKHDTLIVIGETGSGKTTQIPQIIADSDCYKFKSDPTKNNYGRCIACTQPRRVAAQSVAMRVNQERGAPSDRIEPKKNDVGYCIRFDDRSDSFKTKIRYMTDGMLVRESMHGDLFKRYSVIIIDEAHERNINTDVLLTLLRQAQIERSPGSGFKGYPLKIIIMSATMDVDNFQKYFSIRSNQKDPTSSIKIPPVLYIEGRQFPIDLMYLTSKDPETDEELNWPEDHVDTAVRAIHQIENTTPKEESILVFLTGQDEIENCKRQLEKLYPYSTKALFIVPLYAALPVHLQMKAFQTPPDGYKKQRKVILATNIAETSVTVPNIKHVIDCGKCKSKKFNNGIDLLQMKEISQAEATQRAGRTGRNCAGKVYRLYSEKVYDQMGRNIIPEIQRTSVTGTMLYLYSIGKTTQEIFNFHFMDKPEPELYHRGNYELLKLGAIDNEKITELGKKMAEFPISPILARLLLYGAEYKTMSEILSIVALLSTENIFNHTSGGGGKTAEKIAEIKSQQSKFYKKEGDCISYLEVYRAFNRLNKNKDQQREFCNDHDLNARSLRQAITIRRQLREICAKLGLDCDTSMRDDYKVAQKCIYLAFKMNLVEIDSVGDPSNDAIFGNF